MLFELQCTQTPLWRKELVKSVNVALCIMLVKILGRPGDGNSVLHRRQLDSLQFL